MNRKHILVTVSVSVADSSIDDASTYVKHVVKQKSTMVYENVDAQELANKIAERAIEYE